jgi:hypothetical protein
MTASPLKKRRAAIRRRLPAMVGATSKRQQGVALAQRYRRALTYEHPQW